MFIKVCGITRVEDAVAAAEAGVSALGFVFWPGSPRWITAGAAREIGRHVPPGIQRVGVFVNQSASEMQATAGEAALDIVQVHGDETPDCVSWWPREVFRSASLEEVDGTMALWSAKVALLLDAADRQRRGGTGRTIAWARAAEVARQRRVVLAGGLTPENVGDAIRIVRPWGVDVSTGVEASPGIKDAARVRQFVEAARCAAVEWRNA